ncbi:DUF4354 family protein [Pseudochrobactrum kiredjianiae]|uniref:DUF4354 family protein n=1 Tax=Pseudochrobactrum kiredjianiae TaxID=386305 RepID=A0ABW3V5F7_9HYPH|nr:DUF4354 family protein [Pseudochrobactrum kiredjianiae]MDM7851036.1 DUF4354 family protein [Pseudochrobactrum kiredjianiae]
MFRAKEFFIAFLLVAMVGTAYAEANSEKETEAGDKPPMVISSVRELSATSIGDKITYSKSFTVFISNMSKKQLLDLAKGCFKAVMPDKSERKVSVIDAVLAQGKLKPDENRSSFVEFSTDDDSIYKAVAVKYQMVCQ